MMKKGFLQLLFLLMVIPSAAQVLPMDYSYCGYERSEQPIPDAAVKVYVQPTGGDDAPLIQQAIDMVSRQKPDARLGVRGAVLLGDGVFNLATPLRIRTSGVVLRGSGRDRTILRKTGYDRGALLYIEGQPQRIYGDTVDVENTPAGALSIGVKSLPKTWTTGTRLLVWRPSTADWIRSLGCESFGGGQRMGYWAWHPGDIDLRWNRRIMSYKGNTLALDAPVTLSIEQRWGGAKAVAYTQPGLLERCGVENLTLESDYDRTLPKDENHCWDGVSITDAENCWVRMVTFRHFAGSSVVVGRSASQVTVEDCKSLAPVSEIGGLRRRTYLVLGEKTLFQRCYSEYGINDYAAGHTAPGPNAFVQCDSWQSYGPSGSISSMAPGLLFDLVNIDGNDLLFRNLELEKFGAGWNTANSTLWQCTAAGLFCYSPDTLNRNYSIGCWGQIVGNGEYSKMNEHVKPYSAYRDQLLKRLTTDRDEIDKRCRVLERNTTASSSPTMEVAMKMSAEALLPRTTMEAWIDSAHFEADITPIKPLVCKSPKPSVQNPSVYALTNGWITKNGAVLVGQKHQTPWWSGRTISSFLPKAKAALTRFVPGEEGTGLTDRVDSVVETMKKSHTVIFSQNYGLWTDRRRDDHERIRRKNGDVWAPFFEQPFARSGQGTAWDGLSLYDLTKPNLWYFYRLRQFAEKSQDIGILLKNQHYFQHNILEAGAHWVDCPWRTANNVNHTPFLEPVNFTGDKRIFTAQLFYDTTNESLRPLHRQYIRQMLDAFKGQPNVVHSIGEEFTGPLQFVRFWLDVVAEWETENGRTLVALAVTKDVQDSILNDPIRSKIVDIIDIEQWYNHQKGQYAPPGGMNMAPRQYMRKIRGGSVRFDDVYRAVAEYRTSYPNKAVIYSAQKYPEMGWAALMAGGSCANVPVNDKMFLRDITSMKPQKIDDNYLLQGDCGYVVYKTTSTPLSLPLASSSTYKYMQIDAKTGDITEKGMVRRQIEFTERGIYWIRKK